MSRDDPTRVVVGRVSGLHGVRGWVKVLSWTDPRENIVHYDPWRVGAEEYRVTGGKPHGKSLVAKLDGIDDRDAAGRLVGAEISVRRDQLPDLPEGEFYWADLVGLVVVDQAGVELGRVRTLLETGAHDVLVVDGDAEVLVPFVLGETVTEVDLVNGTLRVQWETGAD